MLASMIPPMPNLSSDENEAREAYEASFAVRESVNTLA
jgi:hypothetical protein